jgi:hypothetical protein
MRFRKLQIAWSVSWSLAAVALIVLWVRSYSINDIGTYGLPSGPGYMFSSLQAEISIARFKWIEGSVSEGWSFLTHAANYRAWEKNPSSEFLGIRFGSFFVALPYWIIVASVAILSAMPVLPSRFSLHTLLVATTLVAVLLGLIVWAAR